MTKKEFVELYQEKMEMNTRAEAERAVNGFLATVQDALAIEKELIFTGFGKFETVEREERTGRNPSTGEEMVIPAKRVVKFKAGSKLADAVEIKK